MHKKFANFKTEIFRSFLLLKKINDFVVVGLGRFLDYLNHDFLDLKRTRKCFVFFYVRKIDKNLRKRYEKKVCFPIYKKIVFS